MQIMPAKTATIQALYIDVVLNGVIFSINFIWYCSVCSTLSTCQVLPKYFFNKLCFELPQNVTWSDEQRAWLARVQAWMGWDWPIHKYGPSYLLNENVDLSFLYYFSKQSLVENIQGKFQKNSSVTYFWRITLTKWLPPLGVSDVSVKKVYKVLNV